MLRHDAFQPQLADVREDRRAVVRQVLNELDGAPLGPAEQLGEPHDCSVALVRR